METKMLIAGLGGGLDVINATALWWIAKAQGIDAALGSVKTRSLDHVVQGVPINDNACWITPDTRFADLGVKSRYCEAALARYIQEDILYFGQQNGSGAAARFDATRLNASIRDVMHRSAYSHAIFVDCGGDSLTLVPQDASQYSETRDPFAGGDARTLEALAGIANTYVAVGALGLDVDNERALANVRRLACRGKYCGTLDLRQGNCSEYIFPLKYQSQGVASYVRTVEALVVLTQADRYAHGKFLSLTAPVLYHAIKGETGPQYSAATWAQGARGHVEVLPDYSIMHFLRADTIHTMKRELNSNSDSHAANTARHGEIS